MEKDTPSEDLHKYGLFTPNSDKFLSVAVVMV
jgi:hypothetical protein